MKNHQGEVQDCRFNLKDLEGLYKNPFRGRPGICQELLYRVCLCRDFN